MCDKTRLLFLINFSLVFTSQARLIFKMTLPVYCIILQVYIYIILSVVTCRSTAQIRLPGGILLT